MIKILAPVLLALFVSACSSTSGTQATVEDRTGRTGTASTAQTGAQTGGAQTSGLAGGGVSGTALDGRQIGGDAGRAGAVDDRKNPASPLAQRSVYFDFDSFTVKEQYRPLIEAHAGLLMARRDLRIVLQGNTDARGSREYNLALGQKRAEAVRRALAVLGVPEAQMEAISFGKEKLRNEGDSEEAHAENRRVDIVYADE